MAAKSRYSQEHNTEFKKIEKLQEKPIRIIKFLPNDVGKNSPI